MTERQGNMTVFQAKQAERPSKITELRTNLTVLSTNLIVIRTNIPDRQTKQAILPLYYFIVSLNIIKNLLFKVRWNSLM